MSSSLRSVEYLKPPSRKKLSVSLSIWALDRSSSRGCSPCRRIRASSSRTARRAPAALPVSHVHDSVRDLRPQDSLQAACRGIGGRLGAARGAGDALRHRGGLTSAPKKAGCSLRLILKRRVDSTSEKRF